MAEISVFKVAALDDALINEARSALLLGDPQLETLHDHAHEDQDHAATPPTILVARTGDAFAGYARLHQHAPDTDLWLLDMVIPQASHENSSFIATSLLSTARQTVDGAPMEWWVRDSQVDMAIALAPMLPLFIPNMTLTQDRTVERMERPLGEFDVFDTIPTRRFSVEDADEIVRVNNAAFFDHPDRSDLTVMRLMDDFAHLNNRYDDLRILDNEDGTVGGFIWLREHKSAVGEIYVLGLDKSQQGKGNGRKLLDTGLNHLSKTYASRRALLYVEGTNTRAIALYAADQFVNVKRPLVSFKTN